MRKKPGQIFTFYSYKGGVGRTMALANVATMLSHWGYEVLMIDWDLEAPGLENYFRKFSSIDVEAIAQRKGLIDLLNPDEDDKNLNPGDITLTIKTSISKTPLHLITAGRRDENYYNKVRSFDIDKFYDENDGYQKIEALRNNWKDAYDFVLIDSRTGITDIGGICTIQMPDSLVMLFTPTEIGFKGIIDVAQRALAAQQKLANARYRLTILPIPTRMDSDEFTLMQQWMDRFAEELGDIYKSWLPTSVNSIDILDVTKVPYVPYFSYGEKLPVIEQRNTDATGLRYAYENISALIANQFVDVELLIRDRAIFLQKANLNGNGNGGKMSEVASTREIAKPKKIYLSYEDKDSRIVEKVCNDLADRGYDVYSYRDFLMPGENRNDKISESIRKSDIFLIFISKIIYESEITGFEVGILSEINRTVSILNDKNFELDSSPKNKIYMIPIYLEDITPPSEELKDIVGLDIHSQPYESALKQLIQAIESA